MSILANDVQGTSSDDTISLEVTICGVHTRALIDSGSSNRFLDKDFAIKHNLPMQAAAARNVTVAGGGTLISNAVIKKSTITIQKMKFNTDFKVLPLKGYDMVLGVSWLKKYNPATFDWVNRKLTITVEGQEHSFTNFLSLKKHKLISAKKYNEILKRGAQGFAIQLFLVQENQPQMQPNFSQYPKVVQHILHQYEDIFKEPLGLPPKRDCDHQIILKEGASPPNIKPY